MSIDQLSEFSFEQVEFEEAADQQCFDCGCTIHETETGAKEIEGGVVCRDCFYVRAGDVVEIHPLASSQMRSQ